MSSILANTLALDTIELLGVGISLLLGAAEMDNSRVFAGHDTRNKTDPIVIGATTKTLLEAAQREFV